MSHMILPIRKDDSSNVGGDNSDNIGVGVDNQW